MNAIAQSNSGPTRGGRFGSQTILVVDDDPGIRMMVGAALERAGYSVLQASDANETLEQAKHHDEPIELLITDLGYRTQMDEIWPPGFCASVQKPKSCLCPDP